MDIYEIHRWTDLCEDPDPKVSAQAQAIVAAWKVDIQPEQMWRFKEDDSVVCIVLGVNKKIRIEIDTYHYAEGPRKKIAYFSKKSFLDKWVRMY